MKQKMSIALFQLFKNHKVSNKNFGSETTGATARPGTVRASDDEPGETRESFSNPTSETTQTQRKIPLHDFENIILPKDKKVTGETRRTAQETRQDDTVKHRRGLQNYDEGDSNTKRAAKYGKGKECF